MAPAVTVVGSLNLDLIVTVPALPGRGETIIGTETSTGPGGKGANQAAAAAALSPQVAMVGRVGDDSAGGMLVEDLRGRGVDVSEIHPIPGVPTGAATVVVEQGSAENLIVVAPGANHRLLAADVAVAAVRDARVLLLQLEVPMATAIAAARVAQGRVVLNPAPAQPLPQELITNVDVLVPNEWELARLADAPPTHREPAEIAALAQTLTKGDVVVTLGARGALVVTQTEYTLVRPPAVTAVDTTGAGDCFCGALCVALATGQNLVEATRYAVTAAAISTTGHGARGALPTAAMLARHALTGTLPR